MKVIITFTFYCNNPWKSKFMAVEKPGKLGFFPYFVATRTEFETKTALSILRPKLRSQHYIPGTVVLTVAPQYIA